MCHPRRTFGQGHMTVAGNKPPKWSRRQIVVVVALYAVLAIMLAPLLVKRCERARYHKMMDPDWLPPSAGSADIQDRSIRVGMPASEAYRVIATVRRKSIQSGLGLPDGVVVGTYLLPDRTYIEIWSDTRSGVVTGLATGPKGEEWHGRRRTLTKHDAVNLNDYQN